MKARKSQSRNGRSCPEASDIRSSPQEDRTRPGCEMCEGGGGEEGGVEFGMVSLSCMQILLRYL